MDIILKAKCDVPTRLREDVRRRVEHAARFLPRLTTVEVLFTLEHNPRIAEPASVEICTRTKRGRICVEGRATDHRSAVDISIGRFERALARHKARAVARSRRARSRAAVTLASAPVPALAGPRGNGTATPARPPTSRIVRRSQFAQVAMLPEEAAEQLDLLGHDVLVFTNRATGGFGVVYRRPDGDLGLLEPAEQSQPAEEPARR